MRVAGRITAMLFALAALAAPARGVTGPALSVDLTAPRYPISPYIYGMNFADTALATEIGLPLNRWGGNDTSRYDYRIDTSSKGQDYYFSNIPYRMEGNAGADLPDESTVNKYIDQNDTWGGETIVTVPMMGWMPKAEAYDCSFHIDIYPNQQDFEPWRGECGNGRYPDGTLITGNDPTDASVAIGVSFVTDWVNYLKSHHGSALAGGVQFYNLDNEPMLWNDTHRDVRQTPLSYDELRDRTYAYAAAVKAADPSALTLGPAGFGPTEYYFSALDWAPGGAWWENPVDRLAHGNKPLAPWYLEQMQAYETQHGVRLLDYFDEHFYPQNGVTLNENVDPATQALRLRSTRALWDPTYTDESWIADTESPQLMLIPRMRQWVADNYPGTRTAITEYNWGALTHINGALAQADVLGIFGRERLDLAALWAPPSADDPGAFAFRMYLNYDGAGGRFGDVAVPSASADQSLVSIYSALRASDGALTIIVINKTGSTQTSTIALNGYSGASAVKVFRYSAANLSAIQPLADEAVSGGEIAHDFPPNSITLLVAAPSFSEMVANGSFESGQTGWTAVNPSKDKVKCSAEMPAKFAHDGICGLLLTGASAATTKFKQPLASPAGQAGVTIFLTAWAKAKNLSSALQIKVKLTTSAGPQTLKVPVPGGSYGYEYFQDSAPLIGDLIGGKVLVILKPGAGKAFLDSLSLSVTDPALRAVPAPPIPQGFRR